LPIPQPNPTQKPSFEGKSKSNFKTGQRERGDHDSAVVPAPAPASRTGKPSTWGSAADGMPWPSGRTWFPSTDSRAATKACNASCVSGAERKRRSPRRDRHRGWPGGASRLRHRPMVRDPRTQVSAHRLFVMTLGCSRKSVRLLTFRSSSRIWPSCTNAPSAGWAAPPASSCSTIYARACSSRRLRSTLNPLYRDVLAHYGAVAMLAGYKIRPQRQS